MIKAMNIVKNFGYGEGQIRALREVSLTIEQGEMVSIMGPSGSGKTTLLHTLTGIETIDSGEVWLNDICLNKLEERKLSLFRLQHMGFVFQSYHLIPVLNAVENVMIPLISMGIHRNSAKRKALSALEQVGLLDRAKHFPSELSGGQNQRVAIARSIVGSPKVIWADEPTGALDSNTSEQIIGLLQLLNNTHNTTIVIVTHDEKVAAETKRIIQMENGRILSYGQGRDSHAF